MTMSTPLSAQGISAGLANLELLDLAAVDRESVGARLHLVADRPADRVVLEQERHGVGVAERVVDRDELDLSRVASRQDGPVEGPADPAESVDADAYSHRRLLQ